MKKRLKETLFQREPPTYAPGEFQVGTISDLGLKFLTDSHIASRALAALNIGLIGTYVNVAPRTLYSIIKLWECA